MNTVLIWLGSFAGASWKSVLQILDSYALAMAVIIGVLCVVIGILTYRKKRMKG